MYKILYLNVNLQLNMEIRFASEIRVKLANAIVKLCFIVTRCFFSFAAKIQLNKWCDTSVAFSNFVPSERNFSGVAWEDK